MRALSLAPIFGPAICVALFTCSTGNDPEYRQISLSTLRDKIAGGWAGQMIGVSFGHPTEFRYRESVIPENKPPEWNPDMVANSICTST